ncbi:MAG TPA: GTPase RsgA, partial [Aggregatilineales bacterium]|nr:GTPase RsgA [Aggregatilineales bacterium]
VSGYHEQGVHTTRDSALIKLESGGYLADTPGMRYMTLWDVEPEELDGYFRDIAPYVENCRFNNCSHQKEIGCAVQRAVKAGKVSATRLRSYVMLRRELEAMYALY